MMAEIVTFCVSCKRYLLFVSLFSMQWKLIVYVLQQDLKRSNSVLLLVKWKNKTIEYISKNLIFSFCSLELLIYFFDMKKLMTIKNSLEWNENRLFLYGPFRSFLHPIFYVM